MRSTLTGLAAAVIGLAIGLPAALAEPMVSLTSNDGATKVEGELLEYDGVTYRLRTGLGVMSVRADQVTCEGEGCPGAPQPAPAEAAGFTLSGSNVIGDRLLPALVDGFAASLEADLVTEVGGARNSRVLRVVGADGGEYAAITVEANGTETGFEALTAGSAAFAIASRRVEEDEEGLGDLRDGPGERIIALDGIVVLVHPENPVRALTLDQVAAIFAGRITDWSQLGGTGGQISLYLPDERSGTRRLFEEMVTQPRRMELAETAERLDRHADIADLVSIDPAGIGITSFAYARAARMIAIKRQCGMIAAPERFAIKTEEYPLVRRLYLYGDATGLPAQAGAFADYAVSDEAQPFIASAGFVDRAVEGQGIEAQGARLANSIISPGEFSLEVFREMLGELADGERLSLTFRFTAGSTDLEARSKSEAERFARHLVAGGFSGKEILLVGFADSVGEFDVNRELALRRAESAFEVLKAAVPEGALDAVPILVQSYGELTPVGCNDTADGRELNRRVEVWIRDRRS